MEKENKVFRIGPIRPPSEANSLLLQMTAGCTWNKCKFCQLYRKSPFRAYTVESIKNDIDVIAYYAGLASRHMTADGSYDRKGLMSELHSMSEEEQNCFYMVFNWLAHGGENVFLQDGNSLALKAERVEEVLLYLKSKFPGIKRITTYGRAETLSKITAYQYRALRSAGLERIHSGFESGSDEVLTLINKGVTSEQEITAGRNIKAAGIEFSVYFMPGVGGKELSKENALGTARVINEIDPDFIRIRTTVVTKTSELWQMLQEGTYQLCSDNDKIMEIRTLIENSPGCSGMLVNGDHIINLLPEVNGRLDLDNDKMLAIIDEYLAMPKIDQRIYQLARRTGMVSGVGDIQDLPEGRRTEFERIAGSIEDEKEWDEMINKMMRRFI